MALFALFRDNTSFELFSAVADTDSAGDFAHGSTVGIWLPNNTLTEFPKTDSNGILMHDLSYSAHEDDVLLVGDDEVYIAFV